MNNESEASKFLLRLKEIPDQTNIILVPLRSGKVVDAPEGFKIKENIKQLQLTNEQVLTRLIQKQNYGIYARVGGLCFIDIDVEQNSLLLTDSQLDELSITLKTFTVKTRNGGRHFYFINDTLETTNPHLFVGTKDVGEFRREWQYVVGPGSFYETDVEATPGATGLYQVIRDIPIRKISEVVLPKWLKLKNTEENIRPVNLKRDIYYNDDGTSLSDIMEKDDKLVSLLHESVVKSPGVDRSSTDAAVVSKLYWWGFSDSDIADILQYYRPYEKTDRVDYLSRTIGKFAQGPRHTPKKKKTREPVKQEQKDTTPKTEPQEITKKQHDIEIHDKAMGVLKFGSPVNLLVSEYSRIHMGDQTMGKFLIATIGCSLCSNTDGLHVDISGESGKGKTWACRAMFHQLPAEKQYIALGSKKSMYFSGMGPGTIIFIDDAETLDADMERIIKQKASMYQEKLVYQMADKGGTIKTFPIPERVVFWLTSRDGARDLQLLNRTLVLSPGLGDTQDNLVYWNQVELAKTGEYAFKVTEETEICREMIRILGEGDPIIVVIPFAGDDCIIWNNKDNRRNLGMFFDTIRSFTAINKFQRKTNPDGKYVAELDDLLNATEIWAQISKVQMSKMSPAEQSVYDVIKKHSKHMGGVTQARIAELAGIRQGTVSKALHGIRNRDTGEKEGGLLNNSRNIVMEKGTRETGYADVYKFIGSDNPWEQYTDILKIVDEEHILEVIRSEYSMCSIPMEY